MENGEMRKWGKEDKSVAAGGGGGGGGAFDDIIAL